MAEDDPARVNEALLYALGFLFHSDSTPNFRSYALHKSIV